MWPSADTICQMTVYLPAAPMTGRDRHAGPGHGHAAVAVEAMVRILDVEGETRAVAGEIEQALVGRDDEFRGQFGQRLARRRIRRHQKVVRERGSRKSEVRMPQRHSAASAPQHEHSPPSIRLP